MRYSILFLLCASGALAGMPELYRLENDWLVTKDGFQSAVTEKNGVIRLGNGLVSRFFRVGDLGYATIGLNSDMTGEGVLRSIRADAELVIDGQTYTVGGTQPQPNHAFLNSQWLNLPASADALRLTGYSTSRELTPLLAWKRVRHAAPDAVWPPKGCGLRFYFEPAASTALRTAARSVLAEDVFPVLAPVWREHRSTAAERISFQNEGKTGEIYAPAHTACFVSRELPEGVEGVETRISAGTDQGSSWGPGMAVTFSNGSVVKLNLRPGDEKSPLGWSLDGRETWLDIPSGDTISLRLEWSDGMASGFMEGRSEPLFRVPLEQGVTATALAVGKMDRSGKARDYDGAPGEWGRCRVESVRLLGAVQKPEKAPEADFRVTVDYELYDGAPLYAKWMTVSNTSARAFTIDRYTLERLAVPEPDNPVETRPGVALMKPTVLHVESEQAFGGMNEADASMRHIIHWRKDPLYTSQVNYSKEMPCLLEVSPDRGPAVTLEPGQSFTTPRAFVLIHDSTERERRSLAVRRMYRILAPWVTENPIFFHCVSTRPEVVRQAIDQSAEVGFEMVILSFGSGFNAEDVSEDAIKKWKAMADYARKKGIDLGFYSLLSSRRIGGGNDIVTPPGTRPTHGNCPALTSPWGLAYFEKLYRQLRETGMTVFEHDGSYPGDIDITPRPPLQKGVEDSRRVQWEIIRDFYRWCRAEGIYLTVPDYYIYTGSSKNGMGYREVNWSLPRAHQVLHTRQNIYDGTWRMTPSMGWMFIPLTQYHGGGAAATIEPLEKNLDHYEAMLFSNLSMGVQAACRGQRLYDTSITRERVKKVVAWFKTHREVLERDVIHLRRPDGLDWDGMVHVNPGGDEAALAVVFNPLEEDITREITLPLYYAGLSGDCRMQDETGHETVVPLDARSRARIKLTIPAGRWRWLVFKKEK